MYRRRSQYIVISLYLLVVALLVDKLFIKYDFNYGLMTQIYLGLSFLPLQFKNFVLINSLIFLTYIAFQSILILVILDSKTSYILLNSDWSLLYGYTYQILFIALGILQAYIAEKSVRINFLNLQKMLKSQKGIETEKRRNETLVNSMLPLDIITKMRSGEELIFDFPAVTIMFVQICDFSRIGSIYIYIYICMYVYIYIYYVCMNMFM